ncbi:putative RNA-directed DNA polymerase [Helianthus annuus]|nr:putative RNA-directed DNA polymerase [Helianthus annuus]
MDSKIHPAVTVSNIKNLIPITLEVESAQYSTWAEMFRTICRAYNVSDHLKPRPAATTTDTAKTATPQPEDASWDTLDAIVRQWLYSTVSNDLLNTVIEPGNSAYQVWSRLDDVFSDNKAARALHLTHKFSTTRLQNFPTMTAYCQAIKSIADQLANVDCAVDNKRLVLQLLTGLTEPYESIKTILQSQKPLPSFYEARSQLCMIEGQKAEAALEASQAAAQALTASSSKPPPPDNNSYRPRGRTSSRNNGRGRFGSNRNNRRPPNHPGWPFQPTYGWPPSPWQPNYSWFPPPCPYPSAPGPSAPRSSQANGQGILGPRPSQAHNTTYSPTDIQQALYTMALNPPDYADGVMDSGATISMDPNAGFQEPDAHHPVRQQR